MIILLPHCRLRPPFQTVLANHHRPLLRTIELHVLGESQDPVGLDSCLHIEHHLVTDRPRSFLIAAGARIGLRQILQAPMLANHLFTEPLPQRRNTRFIVFQAIQLHDFEELPPHPLRFNQDPLIVPVDCLHLLRMTTGNILRGLQGLDSRPPEIALPQIVRWDSHPNLLQQRPPALRLNRTIRGAQNHCLIANEPGLDPNLLTLRFQQSSRLAPLTCSFPDSLRHALLVETKTVLRKMTGLDHKRPGSDQTGDLSIRVTAQQTEDRAVCGLIPHLPPRTEIPAYQSPIEPFVEGRSIKSKPSAFSPTNNCQLPARAFTGPARFVSPEAIDRRQDLEHLIAREGTPQLPGRTVQPLSHRHGMMLRPLDEHWHQNPTAGQGHFRRKGTGLLTLEMRFHRPQFFRILIRIRQRNDIRQRRPADRLKEQTHRLRVPEGLPTHLVHSVVLPIANRPPAAPSETKRVILGILVPRQTQNPGQLFPRSSPAIFQFCRYLSIKKTIHSLYHRYRKIS